MTDNNDFETIDNDDIEDVTDKIHRNYSITDKPEEEKKDKLNDIVITQCILCLVLAVGILVLNVFYPDISRNLIEKYKDYSGNSDSEAVSDIMTKAIQAFTNLTQ